MVSRMPGGRGGQSGLGQGGSQDSGRRVFVVCLAVSVVLFVAGLRLGDAGPLSAVRGVFQTVTSPITALGSLVSAPFRALGNAATNLTADQETLSELRAENDELRARNVELEEAEQTAQRLQGLLDLQDAYNLKSTAARIVAGSSDSWTRSVVIDKGTAAGVTQGMPVTDASGVVGQVMEAGPATSTVRLLTDENSSIPAMIQSNRAQGMLRGSVSGELSLTLVPASATVSVGDVVVTSGLGGVFPKGLPLGVVTSVEASPGALYLTITVDAYAHVDDLEEVLVITSLTDAQTADADDIAEADAQERETGADVSSSSSSGGSSSDGSSSSATSDAASPAGAGEAADTGALPSTTGGTGAAGASPSDGSDG